MVQKQLLECVNKKKLFMKDQHVSYHKSSDENWVSKLMFNADFCEHLNDLNVKLQGSGKTLDATVCNINTFEKKLQVSKRDVDVRYLDKSQTSMISQKITEQTIKIYRSYF